MSSLVIQRSVSWMALMSLINALSSVCVARLVSLPDNAYDNARIDVNSVTYVYLRVFHLRLLPTSFAGNFRRRFLHLCLAPASIVSNNVVCHGNLREFIGLIARFRKLLCASALILFSRFLFSRLFTN